MPLRWPWRLRRQWDQQARQAQAEVAASRRALEETRAEVIHPAEGFRDRNHFADIIRASLLEGRNGH